LSDIEQTSRAERTNLSIELIRRTPNLHRFLRVALLGTALMATVATVPTALKAADDDPTSRRMLEEILAKEEEHAEDMKNLLETIGNEERPRKP
jgi:bacterioferritin (cytochrome b1)